MEHSERKAELAADKKQTKKLRKAQVKEFTALFDALASEYQMQGLIVVRCGKRKLATKAFGDCDYELLDALVVCVNVTHEGM